MSIDNTLYKKSIKILTDLIGFKTISGQDNSNLIDYCENILNKIGIDTFKVYDEDKTRVNLFGTLKAKNQNGKKPIILSGHTDVVPVSKGWSSDPFVATIKNNKLYGRGSCDMKGFIACTLAYAHIFKDADPEAIERGALRCFRNSGQSCNAPTRMLVEKSMYSDAIERLKKYTENFEVGDPKKEGEHIGPVISETQYNKIQTLIKKGIDEGAKLVAGGPGKPPGLDKGYFVKPTVFADVNNNMEVARTEIFGPVLSVIPFETEEEAIEIANDTPYGLTNYIQTKDLENLLVLKKDIL